MKEEITLDKIKELQFDILKDIDSFCRKNDIQYSLAYGTLIGAIRHKGYIPWDDDIDIWMPRKEYNKFKELYKSRRFKLIDSYNGCLLPYGKVYDSNTVLIENVNYSFSKGIFVDVFPLDYLPCDPDKALKVKKEAGVFFRLLRIKEIRFTKSRKWWKNGFLFLLKSLNLPFSYKFCLCKLNSIMLKTKKDGSKAYFDYNDFRKSFDIPFEDFKNLKETRFESGDFFIIPSFHYVLTQIYGDFMKLPPVENRKSTHVYKVYFKDDE